MRWKFYASCLCAALAAMPAATAQTASQPAVTAPAGPPEADAVQPEVSAAPLADTPTPDKPWVALAPLPEPAADLAGAAVNGKLYLFGGLAGNRARNSTFEYDTAAGQWSKKKPMPVALHRFAVAAYGDKIFLFGGFKYPDNGAAAWQPVDTCWRYDPARDEWSPLAAMPSKRGGGGAVAVDGKIYVIGGAGITPGTADTAIQPKRRHAVLGHVEEYDPKTDTWRTRSALPTPRSQPAVAAVGGKIYVIGGRIASAFAEDGSDTDVVEAYDPARDLWSRPLERMPHPRSAAGVAMWRNRVVIAGGERSSAKAVTDSAAIDSYDPEKNRWSALAALAQPRRGSAAGLIGDRLYIAGGAQPPAGAMSGDSKSAEKPAEPELSADLRALQLDVVK